MQCSVQFAVGSVQCSVQWAVRSSLYSAVYSALCSVKREGREPVRGLELLLTTTVQFSAQQLQCTFVIQFIVLGYAALQ